MDIKYSICLVCCMCVYSGARGTKDVELTDRKLVDHLQDLMVNEKS